MIKMQPKLVSRNEVKNSDGRTVAKAIADDICNPATNVDESVLQAAVLSVAKMKGIHPPRYNELSACYDGQFLDHESHVFWVLVSKRIPDSTAEECFLKYKEKELLNSGVARFTVKGHALQHTTKWRSADSIDALIGSDMPTSLQAQPAQRRRRAS